MLSMIAGRNPAANTKTDMMTKRTADRSFIKITTPFLSVSAALHHAHSAMIRRIMHSDLPGCFGATIIRHY